MITRSLSVLAVAGALAAQTPPCISLNDATNIAAPVLTPQAFAPHLMAFRITPATTVTLRAAQIYTANVFATFSGYMTLEVHAVVAATGLPGSRLGGGTWQIRGTMPQGWYGANFDFPVTMSANQDYWLVWREPGLSHMPFDVTGVTVPVLDGTNGLGGWVQSTPQPLKWRGFCSLLDGANVQVVGGSCPGPLATCFTNHVPSLGNANFQVEAFGFSAGMPGIAILGANPAWVSVQIPGAPAGCLLHNDALVLISVPIGTGDERAFYSIGAARHCWLAFPLPANPLLAGFTLDVQFAGLNPFSTAPVPYMFTNGLRMTLF